VKPVSGKDNMRVLRKDVRRKKVLSFRSAVFAGSIAAVAAVFLIGADGFRRKQPNILLVSIDALRADHLSCYGYLRETSPNIDALAREGVIFLNAVSHSPKTTESHMSIMTSLHHESHQVQLWKIGEVGARLNDSIPTLAEILKREGYATGAFTDGGNVHSSRGFGKGFDIYESEDETEKAISWLDRNHKKSFFLFYHTGAVHDPYLPPDSYTRMYDPDYSGNVIDSEETLKKNMTSENEDWLNLHRIFWRNVDKESPRDIAFLQAQYDACIRFTDEMLVGRLLDRLKKLGIYDNTLIIFTSDHGEAFGEHNNFMHADIYWETVHVPLVMVYPKAIPEDLKVRQLVRLTDIMPTILDILGLKNDAPIQGRSLLAATQGVDLDLSCYASYGDLEGIRTSRYTYFRRQAHEYFYDRRKDATERRNRIGEEQAITDRLKRNLCEQKQVCETLAAHFTPTEEVSPDREAIDKLKALGYLQ